MSRKVLLLFVIVAVYGCIKITISTSTSFNSQVDVAMGGLSGACSGSATVVDGTGQATVTRALQSDNTCRVEVAFERTIISMADLHRQMDDKVREQGRDPSSVSLTLANPSTLTISNLSLVGLSIPATAWSAELSLLCDPLASLSGDDLAMLADQSTVIPLSDASIAALNTAYADRSDVQVQGAFVLENVSLDVLAGLPADGRAALHFDATADVSADAQVDLF